MEQKDISNLLKWVHEWGVTEIVGDEPMNRLKPPAVKPVSTPVSNAAITNPASVINTAKHPANQCKSLEELYQAIESFDACDLKKTATHTVIYDGNPKAKIMLVGEAPGAEEDRLGKPFVGQSGQLLDKMFQTIGLSRTENLYISNIVYWRPPGNRQPTTQEIALCQPFIEKHIALMQPKILVMLGGVAAKTLLNTSEGIVKLRGKWLEYTNPYVDKPIQALATFHPAYLLRSPGQKAFVWQDLLLIKKALQGKAS